MHMDEDMVEEQEGMDPRVVILTLMDRLVQMVELEEDMVVEAVEMAG